MKNIFVGNLDVGTTEHALRSLFEQHGAVQRVKVMKDAVTGLSRGFAFVEMAPEEAERAIAALNGSGLGDRVLTIREARQKLHQHRRASETPSSPPA